MNFSLLSCLVAIVLPIYASATVVQNLCVAELSKKLDANNETDCPFEITAEVAHVIDLSNNRKSLSLTDESGYAFATTTPLPPETALHPGDVIVATGILIPTAAKAYSRANITNIIIKAHTPPPILPDKQIHELLSGSFDWHPVRIRGVLRDIRPSETSKDWRYAVLGSDGILLLVSFPLVENINDDFDSLIGAEVSITGFCNPQDGSFRLHQGRIFQCNGPTAITPIGQNGSTDPFSSPRIERIRFQTPATIASLGRHLAIGRTIITWDGNKALVELHDGGLLRAEFANQNLPAVGTSVEVVGLPESDLFHLNLMRAIWRPAADISPSAPRDNITHELELFGTNGTTTVHANCHGKPVELKGFVRSTIHNEKSPDIILHLETHNTVIPIHITKHINTQHLPPIGSTISVCGICILTTESWSPNKAFPQITGFLVATKDPSDIRILSSPSLWTVKRLMFLVGAILTLTIGIFIWNIILQKVAARKSRELFKEQLGHVKADLRTEERTRLAVELHDTLAQNLTGVSMEIEAANDLRGNAPQPMLDHLGIAAKALKSCRDELRNCLWDLRSQALEEQDMSRAVLKTLQPIINDSRLAVRFNVPRARLSDNTAHTLLRAIRELVINAIRHGSASSIKVAGTIDQGKLLCSVTDDGCGFDPATAPGVLQGHFGLQGVQERIDEIGGTFRIVSVHGKGTKALITLTSPIED